MTGPGVFSTEYQNILNGLNNKPRLKLHTGGDVSELIGANLVLIGYIYEGRFHYYRGLI
jgi:hypothetical protein